MSRFVDTFMMNDELDMLECRLVELDAVVDRFIVVEADVDHQDHPKPYHLSENLDRFAPWGDRLVVVQAKGLPSTADAPDPWAREHSQREWVHEGLARIDAQPDDVILHGDIDEIPTAVAVHSLRPRRFVAFEQNLYSFAVDWLHPDPWPGTVAARARKVKSFGGMRSKRNKAPRLRDAGWHFSWLGGKAQAMKKLDAFCHPEIADRTREGLESDRFIIEGYHLDGKKLKPVEVDQTWPRFIYERKCPSSWFRPRVEGMGWTPPSSDRR